MDQRKSACAWMSACVCVCECVWMSVCVQERGREEGEETCNRLFRSTFGVSESFLCAVEMQKVAFHFCFFWTISKSARISFFTSLSGENLDREKVAKVRIRRGT